MVCFGRFGDVPPLLFLDGSSTSVSVFPLFPFENPRVWGRSGQIKNGPLAWPIWGGVTPLPFGPATFAPSVVVV